MADTDLQTYIEGRLTALDPTIDVTSGSPAQTQFIQPLLTRLGTDPMETNIDQFITDRFAQEFPGIYAGDPGVVRGLFINPLILLLQPFKREIQTIKNNQSLIDPTILADEDADALAANVFETRDPGGFSIGVGRILFSQPTNQQVDITNRFFTADNLGFFPSVPLGITAEQMVFQKSGNLFYMDVPLKAETQGAQYNIGPGELVGVEGVFGALRVTNLRDFTDGNAQLDTPSFIAKTQESLTERSLNTRRGANARLSQEFQTDVRAIQVIGAKDVEMQRDIIVAASPGHAWLTGTVNMTSHIAYVQCRTVDGSIDDVPIPGDQLYIYLDKYSYSGRWAGLDEASRFLRFTVEEVLTNRMDEAAPFRCSYLIRWSGDLPVGITLPDPAVLSGGFSKKGVVRISSLADTGPTSLAVENDAIHVYGHTDIYARPILQTVSQATLNSLSDEKSYTERTTLKTTASSNEVQDDTYDFLASGIVPGDIMVIETGSDAGVYTIREVDSGTPGHVWLSANLGTTDVTASIRYRIIKQIGINPFEPKVPKFPFGNLSANDLTTTIGSNLFVLTTDVLNFGAAIGDTFRVLTGVDAGDFTITGFDPVLGGRGVIVNRIAGASGPNLQYQIFTNLDPVLLPLVRIKQLLLLDSAKQSTGITIPPAEPVAVVPTCDFTSARVRASSQQKSGYVLPDFTGYVSGGNVAAVSGDRRYSLGFDPFTGTYKAMQFPSGDLAEFDFRDDANGACTYFLAIAENTDFPTNFPPIDPAPGQCLTIKNGPNQGSYLIEDVVKFKHKLSTPNRDVWSYFIKVYGTFPVDVFRDIITFLDAAQTAGAAGAGVTKITNGSGTVLYPDFFNNTRAALGTKLDIALTFYGAASPGPTLLQAAVDALTQVEYEWGDPARGTLRSFFVEPTLFQQHTALNANPTVYEFATDSGAFLHYRPDPTRYDKQELVPARLTSDAQPVDYPRDSDFSTPNQATFSDPSRPTMFNIGISIGDVLAMNKELFFYGSTKIRQGTVQTVAGSTQVTIPITGDTLFTQAMEGNLFFIEEGDDKGGYRVVTFVDSRNLILDKPMSVTTPTLLAQGPMDHWGHSGSDDQVKSSGFDFTPYIGKYVTIWGLDFQWQGSYNILAAPSLGIANVDKTPDFPALAAEANGRFVITDAPTSPPKPNVSGNGTELVAVRPFRMYDAVPTEFTITSVTPSPTSSVVGFSGTGVDGFDQPYRIYRPNVRRVTPTEMSGNTSGSLFFFDTEVVSLEPQDAANLGENSYLTIEDDTYEAFGYRHVVDDFTLTYSMLETGKLLIPTSLLPVNNADSPENFIPLIGTPLQITYERANVVQQIQDFISSPLDRVTSANMLARHFLPSYVSYDATYAGGSAPSVIAALIFSYIDTLPVETPVDVSEIEKIIEQNGGNADTPTQVIIVLHDWDRKMWAEFSENEIGGDETPVPYHGTPRVSYCTPGPDVSGQSLLPLGERINLTRR